MNQLIICASYFGVLIALCSAASSRIEDAADPGAWLAKELGLGGSAASFDRSSPASDNNSESLPEDEQVASSLKALQPLEDEMHRCMTLGQFQQARELNEDIVGKLRPLAAPSSSLSAKRKLYELEMDHASLLGKLNKCAMAIREAHLLRTECQHLPGCNLKPLEHLIQELKTELDHADHYKVLGVAPDAPDSAIKSAYRRLCVLIHPDKISNDHQGLMNELFLRINSAYQSLIRDKRKIVS